MHHWLQSLRKCTMKGGFSRIGLLLEEQYCYQKNRETTNAKNYRPIACQNIMYKLFTGILNHYLIDHCVENDIIALEQAGGKPGSWGCTDQLLINIMILDEVKQHRRSLHMMWFDYKYYLWPADEGRRAKPDDRRWRVIIDLDRRRYHSYTTDNIRDTARYFFFLYMKCIVLTDRTVSLHMNILTTTMNKILTLDKNFRSFIKKHSYLFNTSPFKD